VAASSEAWGWLNFSLTNTAEKHIGRQPATACRLRHYRGRDIEANSIDYDCCQHSEYTPQDIPSDFKHVHGNTSICFISSHFNQQNENLTSPPKPTAKEGLTETYG